MRITIHGVSVNVKGERADQLLHEAGVDTCCLEQITGLPFEAGYYRDLHGEVHTVVEA